MPKRGQVVLLLTFVQGEGGGGRSLRLYSHFFPSHCQCHMKWILMYFCFLEGALKCSLRRGLFSSFAGVIDSFSTKQGKRREGGRGGGGRVHTLLFLLRQVVLGSFLPTRVTRVNCNLTRPTNYNAAGFVLPAEKWDRRQILEQSAATPAALFT